MTKATLHIVAATAIEKAESQHEKACFAMEKAQDREADTYQKLCEAIEEERREALEIYRPVGYLR